MPKRTRFDFVRPRFILWPRPPSDAKGAQACPEFSVFFAPPETQKKKTPVGSFEGVYRIYEIRLILSKTAVCPAK
jgi:hypothetical protein